MTTEIQKLQRQFKAFLEACLDPENFESNPILQDYMTPDLMEYIELEILELEILKGVK